MLKVPVLLLTACLLPLVALTPASATFVDDTRSPTETDADGVGTYAFSGSTYDITVFWDEGLGLPTGTLWRAEVSAGARSADVVQTLDFGDAFFGPLTSSPQFLVGSAQGSTDGIPWLRLDYSFAPTADLPSMFEGVVTLRFHPDHVLHHYGFRLTNGGFTPQQFSLTTVSWDGAAAGHGSILPDGTVVPGDDGSALDPYGKWEAFQRYAVYQESDVLFGHARVAQGEQLNYLWEGAFRVDSDSTEVLAGFNGFLDAGVLGDNWWALDALLFQSSTDPLDLRETYMDIVEPGAIELAPVGDPTAHPVVVGVPDSGINPYHELYYRPSLTMHPCTYIASFPCGIPALPLSIGVYDTYEEAFTADEALWDSVVVGQWYWIPKTVFVAVSCDEIDGAHCILDSAGHGTGTTSSVLTENPNALIAFKEGGPTLEPFATGGIPVDVYSVSWGNVVPLPVPWLLGCPNGETAPIYVISNGNDARMGMLDCWKGHPSVISVGGAIADGYQEEVLAGKQPEVVSYFCRPTADINTLDGWVDAYCGTSFAAPTVAGALSKVIQAVRTDSGYSGGLVGRTIDPVAGFTVNDLRDALNRTATYTPDAEYPASPFAPIPLNSAMPWLQWSWGFFDGTVADATIDHVLGVQTAPEKPFEAQVYMESVHLVKYAMYA